ncbi:MAG: Lrp/AsnC family transcriptional regulator [Nitrososphaerota archaeon]|nr:Lrp/AsnC family transcriptional regulator [Candidatus Calditenuis fumarioli]
MSAVWLDDIDRKILELLSQDARTSYKQMGEAVGLSEGAVRKRVKRLVEQGVIKRFTVVIDDKSVIKALTMINVDPSVPTPAVAESLMKIEGVQEVYEVTGVYDAIALIMASDMNMLNRCIDSVRRVRGVRNTNTCIILKSVQPQSRSR